MIRSVLSWSLGLLIGAGTIASAQRPDGAAPLRPGKAARINQQGGRGGRDGQPPLSPNQQMMIRRVRQAFGGVVKRELNLNDEQLQRVTQVDDKYQLQRNQLNKGERETRQGLKQALEDTVNAPDQGKVAAYMDRLVESQRQRAEILANEQKEFAQAGLTPVQRAKYFALRDQLQKRVAEMRQEGRRGGPPPQ